jgi:hypothetical protein
VQANGHDDPDAPDLARKTYLPPAFFGEERTIRTAWAITFMNAHCRQIARWDARDPFTAFDDV